MALLGLPRAAWAQGTADQVVTAAQADREGLRHVPWHDSTVLWQQRVTTQTVGVGGDYQSDNPYYDWIFYVRPRYYLWENERSSLSVRGQIGASVELTNSDTTTDENEFLLDDTLIAFSPEHAFVRDGEYLSDLTLSLPRVVIPTSKAGFQVGKILEVGVRALFVQAFPLRENDPLLPRAYFGLRAGYGYQFARSVVPEQSSLDQLRMNLDGVLVTNDQLGGAALSEHMGVLHAILHADVFRDIVALETEFGIDPAYKFALSESAPVCLSTGCVEPQTVEDPSRLSVISYLDVSVNALVLDHSLRLAVGYENVTSQLAADGTRRGALWSPDAKFYFSLEFQPDLLLKQKAVASANARGTPGSRLASTSR